MCQSKTEKLFRLKFNLYHLQPAVRILPHTLLVALVAADRHSY
jgi:hypothetical protein